MRLTRDCDECIDSLAAFGTVNLRWPDDCIVQPAGANRFFSQPFGTSVSAARWMRADSADVDKMLARIADRQQLFCELGVHPKVFRCIISMRHSSPMQYDLRLLQSRRLPDAFFQSPTDPLHSGVGNRHIPPMHERHNVDARCQPV